LNIQLLTRHGNCLLLIEEAGQIRLVADKNLQWFRLEEKKKKYEKNLDVLGMINPPPPNNRKSVCCLCKMSTDKKCEV